MIINFFSSLIKLTKKMSEFFKIRIFRIQNYIKYELNCEKVKFLSIKTFEKIEVTVQTLYTVLHFYVRSFFFSLDKNQ